MKELQLKLSILNTLIASRPLFIYLTMIMVYILIFIYSADPCLCQGLEESTSSVTGALDSQGNYLESLKTRLDKEVITFQLAREDHEQWSSIWRQVTRSPSARVLEECSDITKAELNKIWALDDKLRRPLEESCNNLRLCTSKMRATEVLIHDLDPSFKSSIKKQWYEISTSTWPMAN